jgi:hypothetical protein
MSRKANVEVKPEGPKMVRWTIVVPIAGEATLEVMLPEGSTKYDAVRAYNAYNADKCRLVDHEWGYADDDRTGEEPIVTGPGCQGEDVCLDDEADEQEEDEE